MATDQATLPTRKESHWWSYLVIPALLLLFFASAMWPELSASMQPPIPSDDPDLQFLNDRATVVRFHRNVVSDADEALDKLVTQHQGQGLAQWSQEDQMLYAQLRHIAVEERITIDRACQSYLAQRLQLPANRRGVPANICPPQ